MDHTKQVPFDEVSERKSLVGMAMLEFPDLAPIIHKAHAEGRKHFEVKLVVDGVDMPLDPFFDMIEKEMNKIVEDRARVLLDRKFADMLTRLEEVRNGMMNQLRDFPSSEWDFSED